MNKDIKTKYSINDILPNGMKIIDIYKKDDDIFYKLIWNKDIIDVNEKYIDDIMDDYYHEKKLPITNKVEKYLIYKRGTNDIECLDFQGETVLSNISKYFHQAKLFNTQEDAEKEIEKKKNFYEECEGRCALYYYDNETKSNDLGILKLTIEECN